ncbi:MAG TPA: alpha-glucan family phosphorylase [Planctomycetota bacterium]|nr:alpha-glucan family phosphorylase [Planctomycetota bacterium]
MIQKYTVIPRVPARLRPLLTIAKNLWWISSRNALSLFRRIDMDLWEESNHNPVLLIGALQPERLRSLADDHAFLAHMDEVHAELEKYLGSSTWYTRIYGSKFDIRIAYFSAEFGLHESMPLYSGGLGILSGDHIKSADELGLPLVGVGLCYQHGYYRQYLSSDGWQQELYPENDFYNMPLTLVRDDQGREVTVEVTFLQRRVEARLWRVQVGRVPVYLLDSNLPTNEPVDRVITSRLYGGDLDMRIRQELLLGIGGYRALVKLNLEPTVCHMNEGHSAFLAVERIRLLMQSANLTFAEAREAMAACTAFTTHTPVPAGNDRFPPDMVRSYLRDFVPLLKIPMETFLGMGRENPDDPREDFCMTVLALKLAAHSNGVSQLHGRVSRRMWKRIWPAVPEREVPITHITNGVHTHSWLSEEFARLFERYLEPKWHEDPVNQTVWQRVDEIPDNELWRAKERLRDRLVSFLRRRQKRFLQRYGAAGAKLSAADEVLNPEILTIGFARRFATYKRASLILRDLGRLRKLLLDKDRPVQLLIAGKAHPHDGPGKEIIRQISQLARQDELHRHVVFIEDYDIDVARHLVQGADVWLNTPLRPLEASGTSGMKASMNGTLNLSILDGWWVEGYGGDNGWSIGNGEEHPDREYQDQTESTMLYDLLEKEIIPTFYRRGPDDVPREWIQRMKASIRTICPRFNTNRMVEEYAERIYLPGAIHGAMLAKEGYRAARMLSTWKRHIQECWHEVSVLSVHADTSKELEIGSNLELRVRVLLGSLQAEEISVEVLYGPIDAQGEIVAGDALPLNFASSEGSVAVFDGHIPCGSPGQHGFVIRVLPFRRELANKFETGKITWWSGNVSLPQERVAEKVSSLMA